MLEWVLFLSQLGLWVMVIQLYRTRSQEQQNLRIAAEEKAQEESLGGSGGAGSLTAPGGSGGIGPLTAIEFDFLDTEAVTRMATIRTLLDEIEERTHRLTSNELSTQTPSTTPIPSSAEEGKELTAFLAKTPLLPRRSLIPDLVAPADSSGRDPVAQVRGLASSGLDASSIARTTGRQLEEVNLLLHLAKGAGTKRTSLDSDQRRQA